MTTMTKLRSVGLALALSALAGAAQGQVADKKVLTLDGAKQVAAAAAAEARRLNAPGGAIAVVDDGGYVLYVERLDNTFPAAANISIAKARTAALFRRASKGLEDAIVGGRTTLLNVAEAPLQGGEPIVIGGVVVGAIGVSGAASAQQDEEIAKAAADAFQMQVGAAPARPGR
jgi:glc operon protein GlcG